MGKEVNMDVRRAKEQAEKEVAEEHFKKATDRFKTLLKQKAQAEEALKNINREIEDLEAELAGA